MTSDRFDTLVITLGATAILGSFAVSLSHGLPDTAEVLGQLMLLVVLFAAVKGGRRVGGAAAIAASVVYILARLPVITDVPISPLLLAVVLSRFAAYGLVGIVGGEVCSRIRFGLAGVSDAAAIDDWSRAYNQKHAAAALERAVGRFTRYGEQFSLLLIAVSPAVFADMKPIRQRRIVRAAADYIRNDIRLVDEVARLDDGRFLVLLPHTPRNGAEVVRNRMMSGLTRTLGSSSDSVTATVLGAPEDFDALNSLAKALAPAPSPDDVG